MLFPRRVGRRSEHLVRVVSAAVFHGELHRLRHPEGAELQDAREGGSELEEARIAAGEHHRGAATHRESLDPTHLGGSPLSLQQRGEFLRQERLPLVVLAVVRLGPVGVETRLATDGQDNIDVLVLVEVLDVGVEDPAALIVLGPESVEHVHLRELVRRTVVPVAGQQQLHLNVGAHRRRVHPHRHPAVGVPERVGDLDAWDRRRRLERRSLHSRRHRTLRCGGGDRNGRGHTQHCAHGYRAGHQSQCAAHKSLPHVPLLLKSPLPTEPVELRW